MKIIVKTIIPTLLLLFTSMNAYSESTTYTVTNNPDGSVVESKSTDATPATEEGTATSYSVTKKVETRPSPTGTPVQSTSYTTTTTSSITSNQSDNEIVSAIYTQFAKQAALIGTSLSVTSSGGYVSINGSVINQSQADAAVSAARSVRGVKDVRSYISVSTNPDYNRPAASAPNY